MPICAHSERVEMAAGLETATRPGVTLSGPRPAAPKSESSVRAPVVGPRLPTLLTSGAAYWGGQRICSESLAVGGKLMC